MSKLYLYIVAAVLILSTSLAGHAQNYYVIIGAFKKENNARKFAGYARSRYLDAAYLPPTNDPDLYYVYVMKTSDKERAHTHTLWLQKGTEFTNAWTYYGLLANDQPVTDAPVPVESAMLDDQPVVNTLQQSTEKPAPEVLIDKNTTLTASTAETVASMPVKARGKFFKFIVSSADGKTIPGEVHYVDRNLGRDLADYKANQRVDVVRTAGPNIPMTLVCGIFGYQEVVKMVDYNNPAGTTGAYLDENGVWVVPYQLERLRKGNSSVMYHTSFFKDAVVMTHESKTEMDELVNMMKLNPNYVIKVHGHCNGTHNRRIIALGTTKNYFDVKGSDERPGTAKELSLLRAEAIQAYLIDNGIDKNRVKVFAWGGSHMLVDQTSNAAKLNDRIEIEILQD